MNQEKSTPLISLLTWNIALNTISASAPLDWDSDLNLIELLKIIEKIDPDILILQEMPHAKFAMRFVDYLMGPIIESHSGFTTFLVKRSKFKLTNCAQFNGCVLGTVESPQEKFYLVGTHLLPYKENEKQRLYQIAQVLLKIASQEYLPIIIAGDMNMRENETKAIFNLDFKDAFFEAGSPKDHKFSWNSRINKHPHDVFEFTARFDRIFIQGFKVISFQLTANSPVSENRMHFISDHFAIYVELEPQKNSEMLLDDFF